MEPANWIKFSWSSAVLTQMWGCYTNSMLELQASHVYLPIYILRLCPLRVAPTVFKIQLFTLALICFNHEVERPLPWKHFSHFLFVKNAVSLAILPSFNFLFLSLSTFLSINRNSDVLIKISYVNIYSWAL